MPTNSSSADVAVGVGQGDRRGGGVTRSRRGDTPGLDMGADGHRGFRVSKLNAEEAALARRMKSTGETAATICRTLGIGRTTLYRYLAEDETA